jgi:hypothetical protein
VEASASWYPSTLAGLQSLKAGAKLFHPLSAYHRYKYALHPLTAGSRRVQGAIIDDLLSLPHFLHAIHFDVRALICVSLPEITKRGTECQTCKQQ